jgi:hypothetical protein
MAKYLETAEVSRLLKRSILNIEPNAKVSVRVASNFFTPKGTEVREIDVYIKNFNRIVAERLNRIAAACRSHQSKDPLYGTDMRRWLLAGEIAEQRDEDIQVTWRSDQQTQLLMFAPEEVSLGCDQVNLYMGRGTTGPFTGQSDFNWVLDRFTLCENGYAYRTAD